MSGIAREANGSGQVSAEPPRETDGSAHFVGRDYRSVTSMQEILEAIQSGASGDGHRQPPTPRELSGRVRQARRGDMFEGVESWDKDPRKSLHVGEVPTPELAPDEVYIAVMASSHQLQHRVDLDLRAAVHVRLPRPMGTESRGQAPRPDVPRRRLRRLGRRAAGRLRGAQLEARRPGHGALQLRRRPGPDAPTTTRCWRQPAHLGLRDQLRRPRRPAVVKANQLMPKPTHLSWEEAAVNGCATPPRYRMLVGATPPR
jgi:crotonyl-CoA reductase